MDIGMDGDPSKEKAGVGGHSDANVVPTLLCAGSRDAATKRSL